MKYEVVVCRFVEPWEMVWSLHDLLNKSFITKGNISWTMLVYDRSGLPYDGGEAPSNVVITPCQNIGREAYVVLHYLHSHYHSLSDFTFFIPANWMTHRRLAVQSLCMQHGSDDFCPKDRLIPMPWNGVESFVMDEWFGLDKRGPNTACVKQQAYTKAKDRPFGVWYKKNIPVPWKDALVWNGIFSVSRSAVHRYTQTQYASWLEEISQDGPNAELAHYWERAWYSMFA